ncbi:hypothetical protein ACH35V_20005 [Actinomadura sp. 1N219]|uniref:AtuA-related protein n=1 Tax=Actinomadura sp. 1N219 TaxID=3375152 RepID=UPI0037BB0CC5
MSTGRLADIAYARSGDKGDTCNVGLMAKSPELYARLLAEITEERVREHLGDLVRGRVDVHRLDNLHALNVVLHRALAGGATRSTRFDQTGKAMCMALLRLPLRED